MMRVPCPTPGCTTTVTAPDAATGRALLTLTHWCEAAPVDPANDPRRPRSDEHADAMERQRLGRGQR